MEYRFFMPWGLDVENIDRHKLKICQHLEYAHESKNTLSRAIRCRLIHGDN